MKDNKNFPKLSKKIQNKVIGLSEAKFQGQLNLFVHVFSINTMVEILPLRCKTLCNQAINHTLIRKNLISVDK